MLSGGGTRTAVSRRRLQSWLWLVPATLLTGIVATCGSFAGSTEHIEHYWTAAEFDAAGPVRITEAIDYYAPSVSGRHGIYRDVPGLVEEDLVGVSSPTAPGDVELSRMASMVDTLRIRIGDPDVTIEGHHRYTIVYDCLLYTSDAADE